jgi:hypothetical protein
MNNDLSSPDSTLTLDMSLPSLKTISLLGPWVVDLHVSLKTALTENSFYNKISEVMELTLNSFRFTAEGFLLP